MSGKPLIYMDACCFIDLATDALSLPTTSSEPHRYYCRKFLDAARAKDLIVYTSTMSVIECIAIKDRSADSKNPQLLIDDVVKGLFRGMLMSAKSGVMPVIPTPRITEAARDLRWTHEITCKPMDALHLATAIEMKCTHFFTTDGLGAQNIEKLKEFGLVVCTADLAKNQLPAQYAQYELQAKNAKAPKQK